MVADPLSLVGVARLAAAAAVEAPDVVGLHSGAVGEIATYGGGTSVKGVRVHDRPEPRIRLYLIVRFGAPLDALAQEVRARVREALNTVAPRFAAGRIDVHVADVSADGVLPVGPPEEAGRWN